MNKKQSSEDDIDCKMIFSIIQLHISTYKGYDNYLTALYAAASS
jgi:hypothetical protein